MKNTVLWLYYKIRVTYFIIANIIDIFIIIIYIIIIIMIIIIIPRGWGERIQPTYLKRIIEVEAGNPPLPHYFSKNARKNQVHSSVPNAKLFMWEMANIWITTIFITITIIINKLCIKQNPLYGIHTQWQF